MMFRMFRLLRPVGTPKNKVSKTLVLRSILVCSIKGIELEKGTLECKSIIVNFFIIFIKTMVVLI